MTDSPNYGDLTAEQQATLTRLLTEHGPGAAYALARDEEHDQHVFVSIYDSTPALRLDTIIDGDGTVPDDS